MTFQVHDLATSWWAWTATMSVQVLVLVLIVALLDLLARWSWPQLRAALWFLVMVKLVLPPTLTSPWSVCQLSTPPAEQPPAFLAPTLLFWIWLAGIVILAAFGARRYLRLRRAWLAGAVAADLRLREVARAAANRLGLKRLPRLLTKQDVGGPAVLGFLRPVVVLPASLANGPRETLEHVLLHELAHVRRRDPLASLACLALQLLYWFHPGVWWARRRLASLRELCCDQAVATVLGEATPRYRRTLLELSRPLIEGSAPGVGSLAFIHRHSQLLARLDWLSRPLPRYPLLRRVATAILCSWMLLCCVPLAQPSVSPTLADLKGCMQIRFAVFQALAEEERRQQND